MRSVPNGVQQFGNIYSRIMNVVPLATTTHLTDDVLTLVRS